MPRSPDQNQALRAATRERLLRSALTLFARDGYAGTSVRTIAEHAGVATGLLYAHFAGKEELLHALFEQSMADVRASMALADAQPQPQDQLSMLVLGSVTIIREHLDFWRLGYAARTQPAVLAALGPALDEWTQSIVAALQGYLARAGSTDPVDDARALFAQIDGLCQHFALDPERYPVDAVARRIIARWTPAAVPAPPAPQ